MSWVPVYDDVTRNKKTRDAAKDLRITRHQLVGHLVAFWTWAVDKEPDGGPLYAEDIALNAEWEGKADRFVQALTEHGFLEVLEDGRYRIHDWEDGGGRINRMRAGDRQRKRRMRAVPRDVPQDSDRDNRQDNARMSAAQTEIREDQIRDPERAHAQSEADAEAAATYDPSEFIHQRRGRA